MQNIPKPSGEGAISTQDELCSQTLLGSREAYALLDFDSNDHERRKKRKKKHKKCRDSDLDSSDDERDKNKCGWGSLPKCRTFGLTHFPNFK
ncbi:hypothetical protein L596_024593 [Steinernema carpocapsae]|uniref:Uncharacterized protein n=1 Tax=Steinernema carpocapsae TaxID=34508 RepID=A0A4V5ZZZ2_STECR|nr:hypothetical protein L596_024593 [Steinernema carpocapsae]